MTAIALITGASGGIGRVLAVFMLQTWIGALQGGPGAAVFASWVVPRIGVANH